MKLNGTALGDAAHPAFNFFDSSISQLGTPVSGSNPAYKNQLGFDAGVLAVPPGVVGNNQTSATIDLSTVNDRYLPGVVYFRTDIYAPQMVLHKTVTDVNGGAVLPGRRAAVRHQLDQHGSEPGLRLAHQRCDPAAHGLRAGIAEDPLEPGRGRRHR